MFDVPLDTSWTELASLPPATRLEAMTARCRDAAVLPEHERLARVSAMVRAEYALDDAALAAFTADRLRAWLALDAATADVLGRSYDAVFNALPAVMALRRASVVQRVARNELSADEVDRLFLIIPSIVQQVPRAGVSVVSPSRRAPRVAPATAGAGSAGRPWWKFWMR